MGVRVDAESGGVCDGRNERREQEEVQLVELGVRTRNKESSPVRAASRCAGGYLCPDNPATQRISLDIIRALLVQ